MTVEHSAAFTICHKLSFPNRTVASMTLNQAIVLGTLGICLGFVEFNRPGRILPGAVGLLLLLLACARLAAAGLRPTALLLLAAAVLVLLGNLLRSLPAWLLILAIAAIVTGLHRLPANGAAVPFRVALPCGTVLGALAAALSRIAFRARRAKALD